MPPKQDLPVKIDGLKSMSTDEGTASIPLERRAGSAVGTTVRFALAPQKVQMRDPAGAQTGFEALPEPVFPPHVDSIPSRDLQPDCAPTRTTHYSYEKAMDPGSHGRHSPALSRGGRTGAVPVPPRLVNSAPRSPAARLILNSHDLNDRRSMGPLAQLRHANGQPSEREDL